MLTEREIVRRLTRLAPRIGDDCAILPNGKEDLLVTTDQFIQDVHFLQSHPAGDIGWNAAARGLSDIAAMGGEPRYLFLSVALPNWVTSAWLDRFFAGVTGHRVELAGGDLAHSDRMYCDITAIGYAPKGKALRRTGARPGDHIYVSGALGRPKRRIRPRLALGLSLRGTASSCMDISDGLSLDLTRLCEASGVGAELSRVPIASGATLNDALHRGEDYELLFTSKQELPHRRIGRITAGSGVTLNGQPVAPKGYDHFA